MAQGTGNSITKMLTPRQVGERLGVKPERVIGWLRSGKLRGINVSDGALRPRFRIDPADLAIFEQRRAVVAPAKPSRRRRRSADVIEFF